jgi:hypothetical protein
VDEKLVSRVLRLQYQARELSMQVNWFRANLERCLVELEAEHELEPIEFDWAEAMGLPEIKSKADYNEQYDSKNPFCIPYRGINKPKSKTEKYTDVEMLSAVIDLTSRTLENNMFGMDEYIKHLEKRLARLEEYIGK